MNWLKWLGVAGAVFLLIVTVPPSLSKRAARLSQERHHALMDAIGKRDVAAIQKLAGKPVDIYATDTSGESPLSLAEKSGDAAVLDALNGWHDRQKDLRRIQRAVETGTTVGLQPLKQEPALSVPRIVSPQMAYTVEQEINALPEGERKEWALRNFASRLAEAKLFDQARSTALRLQDPKMRVESLLNIGQGMPKGPMLEILFDDMRYQIQPLSDAGVRDPLYAQLAWLENLRGYPERARSTCFTIQLEQYKNGTCKSASQP